jgi:hypothetical protein
MNDQPREEKVPEGTEPPTVEQPTTVQPTAEAAAADQAPPAPSTPEPAAPADAPPSADQTAVHGQPPPPTPQLSQPGPGQAYGAWGPPPAARRQPGGFRRFVGHRATQLVGVGVLGVLIGGGIVGGIAAATDHHGGRPGIHRQYGGPNGNQGFNGHGPGFRGGNPGHFGNSGNSAPGDGI